MSGYNMDFLVAALVILLLVLYHFISRRKLDNENNRKFFIVLILGTLDVSLDLAGMFLVQLKEPALIGLTSLVLDFLFVVQLILLYQMFCYCQSLRSCEKKKYIRATRFGALPLCFMLLAIMGNFKTGAFFYIDAQAEYCRGFCYNWMYYYTFFYIAAVLFESIWNYRELGMKRALVLWEFLAESGICVVIQALNGSMQMTGFGIALAITTFYLNINNPIGYTDNLTGVFDKQYLGHLLQEQIEQGKSIHIFAVELYQLKRVNKMYGSSAGDTLLIRTAGQLQAISEFSYVFRIAGNCLLVLTNSLPEYERLREKAQSFLKEDPELNGERIHFPAIMCSTACAERLQNSDAMLAYAEYLLSLAPRTGESLLIRDNESTMAGFRYEKEIEHFLNTAIEKDLFEVVYQPVYSIEKKRFTTLEALSRLSHPTLGPVSPEVFIAAAEKSGQIAQLGLLQFRRVCRFLKAHPELREQIENVKCNLSPLELLKQGHSAKLLEIIQEFDLPCSCFQFEITETAATEYSDNLFRAVSEFLEAGICLCLDDFGSGYANLNTVLQLPFSVIKLDRSLLSGICEDQQVAVFYQNICMALKNMGYKLVAEGVETAEEAGLVGSWGVQMIQGYYYSRPLREDAILELFSDGKNNEN